MNWLLIRLCLANIQWGAPVHDLVLRHRSLANTGRCTGASDVLQVPTLHVLYKAAQGAH